MADSLASLQNRQVLFFVEDLQQMKELVDLRRSDQMKSNFLSLISHELRTPLASIKGAIHLLNQMEAGDFKENAERIFVVLHRNIDRLTSLVNNILDAMDLDTHSLRLYRKRTDLHELVEKVVGKMQGNGAEKSIAWQVELAPSHEGVYVDESRLGQVVEHLLENALKFTSANGKIRIETVSGDKTWTLRVANSGRPIDASLHEKIFSRFYQVDGTLTRYYGGSGLGLYLCREIVRLHGGDIRIDPSFQDGACFEVTVPEITELV
jgi:signal transduction histidine kinase